jgi:hypothetical protein
MANRLAPANGRRLAALALLGALCACATTSAPPRPEVQPAGWRIVERIGEARYSPPGAAAWLSATVGEMLADGSEVSTGRGGRLIVDGPERHISVGPDSRFVLPDRDRDDRLNQRAGWLRYRIAKAAAEPFRIHTRSLELELLAGVVDVHVNHNATEVTVKEGQVRVATPDGLRQTQMMAGQSAQADGSLGMQLAVRLAPGAALRPVDPEILPAVHPKPPLTETPKTSAAASSPPAELHPLPPVGTAAAPPVDQAAPPGDQTAPPGDQAAPVAFLAQPRDDASGNAPLHTAAPRAPQPVASLRAGASGTEAIAQPEGVGSGALDRQMSRVEGRAAESEAAAIRRNKFERLTAGMLDQVAATRPAPVRW